MIPLSGRNKTRLRAARTGSAGDGAVLARSSRGFTLVELLVAIAIFSVLAGMLFQIVQNALDLWADGEQNRESMEKGATLIHEIAKELRMIRAEPIPGDPHARVRIALDYGLYDLNLDNKEESLIQRLAFVRSLPEERFDGRLRSAGDSVGGTDHLGDVVVNDQEAGRAPGGLAEVAFTTMRLPEKDDKRLGIVQDPALLSLVRLFRTPIGGSESLFTGDLLNSAHDTMTTGVLLSDNILFLGFEVWSRDTIAWDTPAGSGDGPLTVWDSTRGVMVDSEGPNVFALTKGTESLRLTYDDVFPRRMRITLVVERDEDEAHTAVLNAAVSPRDKSIEVRNPIAIDPASPFPFLKINGEWMRMAKVSGGQVQVERGVRGTAALAHEPGAKVHQGDTWRRVVEIPVYREDWNDK